MRSIRFRLSAVTISLSVLLSALPATAQEKSGGQAPSAGHPVRKVESPMIWFNQDYIEGLYTNIDIKKPMNVFRAVFARLRPVVTVYPTENYYYFQFNSEGKTWWGNLRLDAVDRDKGFLHLGYFKYDDYGRYRESNNYYKKLGPKVGVTVKKKSRFVYTVTYRGKTVTFRLYDIGWKPPVKTKLRRSEVYVGPVFDESGTRFHLIFDKVTKHFMYFLNEDGPVAERWEPVNRVVVVGERTGFAYYRDDRYGRYILIGIHGRNAQRNNYFDGPFDQLPDNYIEKSKLGYYIQQAYPFTKGKVDKYGNYLDREASRFSISNYKIYYETKKLNFVFDCLSKKHKTESAFYKCLVPDVDE